MIFTVLLSVSLVGLFSSTIYLILTAEGARRFVKRPRAYGHHQKVQLPALAILKPVHGLEPRLRENLESFFLQDYPDFELIFGAREMNDPALKVVEDLRRKYPDVKTKVLFSGRPEYPNAKVFTLEKMIEQTAADYLVITDSDTYITPDCMREVVTPLLDRRNGLVTCLYKGIPAGGFWSRLEALGMSVELPSGVLVASIFETMRFALGPIMATRRDVIESIGGISAVADYHADDYKLGNLTHGLGKNVILSRYICGHVAMNTSIRMSIAHQTRWMRSTRFSRSAGHVGTGLTYAMPFGILGMIAGWIGHKWQVGAALLVWAVLNRVLEAIIVGWKVIGDREALTSAWLYPARDLLGFFIWCGSFMGDEMIWRNERYRFVTDGKIVRL